MPSLPPPMGLRNGRAGIPSQQVPLGCSSQALIMEWAAITNCFPQARTRMQALTAKTSAPTSTLFKQQSLAPTDYPAHRNHIFSVPVSVFLHCSARYFPESCVLFWHSVDSTFATPSRICLLFSDFCRFVLCGK